MYIESGYLDVNDKVVFNRHSDVCNEFGHNYKQWYRAVAKHPVEPDLVIWFPKMFENDDWENSLSEDKKTIYERRRQNNDAYVQECLQRPEWFRRLVFGAEKGSSGRIGYRFLGLFEIDVEASRKNSVVTYRRKATRVKTYSQSSESL